MNITIFSRAIHSGKTTELLKWCTTKKSIGGILMPEIKGKKTVMDIRTKKIIPTECINPDAATDEVITVGRYNFYVNSFKKANALLIKELERQPEWLIIDEVGKLELQGKGFYDSAKLIIDYCTTNYYKKNLLLVVRDSLIHQVVKFFNIKMYRLIYTLSAYPKTY